jgi:hypothetical protein
MHSLFAKTARQGMEATGASQAADLIQASLS